jgi:predicted amino acid-binding ACT domain protein
MATASAGRTMFSRLMSIPLKYPMSFGAGLSCVKTSGSDLLVQKVVEQRDEIDWKRNIAFGTFGLCYLGVVQYSIYVSLFGRMFPNAASFAAKSLKEKLKDVRGMAALGAQVVLDQCVHHPFLYFPVFYATKELVVSDKPDLRRCLTDYWNNMSEDLVALWKIWVPCTIVNFAFMPMHLRIPFTAGVSMVWSCVLSAMRGGDVAHGEDIIGGAITGATLKIFEEGLGEYFTCPVELDRDMAHVVLSASGPDKSGWVALLTRAVADQGGNVTYSRMVRLGSDFIILVHVAVPPEQQRTLIAALKKNKELKPLNLRTSSVTRRMTGNYDKPIVGLKLHCVGEDRCVFGKNEVVFLHCDFFFCQH